MKQICYSLKVHWIIIWSRLKSQSLGSELGQYSSSMYLDLTAHTNPSASGKIAACLRIGEYEKYYYLRRVREKKTTVVDHSNCQTFLLHLYYSQFESCFISSQTNSLLLGKQKSPLAFFFFSFLKSRAMPTAPTPPPKKTPTNQPKPKQLPSRFASCLN